MKRIALFFTIIFCVSITFAQKPELPKRLSDEPFKIVANRTTMNYSRKKVSITVWIDKNAPQGMAARFKSNVLISNLEVAGSGSTPTKNVHNYPDGSFVGLIYLNAPAYYKAETFILSFYMAGLPKAIWKTAIQRQK